ncbi:tRNA uridine-5-carboxymethylaminomethyl(34) synthesis GTPase MnmE [Pararhodospirillum oryzae]|uniref:tRNA modification GTPase MnmE n=1 Tax=Pararhodospirillum oryzae TaxID=478448 RepID=A0A512H3K5_9PROT|nr:tRNA uridine-5-carboxymethylaminomethyl(34) synthesis GTPase MnmE [Pararhodospirillum oryzae]GEO80042.1 tRNA modification GTPase MnmE [Pararhodospirillum oryzae]
MRQNDVPVQATIFAPATARGRGGVAVVRISGPEAGAALRALSARDLPAPRRATRACLRDPASGEALDDALVLWFPGPGSFTGEDVAELHVHGGRAVVMGVLEALGRCSGLRLAEPGEFTRRAFVNGKMDLTAAEALADLVNAETEAQRRQALRQADGALLRLVEGWRDTLLRLLAHLEAVLDFPDEELPETLEATIGDGLRALRGTLARHLAEGHRGERLREGVRVAVIGAPNAGKSSLVNQLARREAAIVSETAGTTRDVIEIALDLGGIPLLVADTAGIRDTADPIEAEGVRRAWTRHADADLTVVVQDGTLGAAAPDPLPGCTEATVVRVRTRADLCPEAARAEDGPVWISCRTGAGMARLEQRLLTLAQTLVEGDGSPPPTRLRHRMAIQDAVAALERAEQAPLPELRAEDMRLALRALGRLTGQVGVEDVLDVIFRDFCLGK